MLDFQDQCHQPLGHLSMLYEPAKVIISGFGGDVNEKMVNLRLKLSVSVPWYAYAYLP